MDSDVDINESTSSSPLSIAVDSTNTPHISYYEYSRRNVTDDGWDYEYDLMYATKSGGTWTTADVDADGDTDGEWNSIAVDSQNIPHISYYDNSNHDLRYAYRNVSMWQNELVDTDGYRICSIAIGPNDRPQIGYADEQDKEVKLARHNGSSWEY